MEQRILLTPEELYYLGNFLQARYIDYAYVAAMDDIGQNYNFFEKETGAALVRKGILTEDFSGNREISASVTKLLRPVFFGEEETSIDICELGTENKVRVFKFHFLDGTITRVAGNEGKLLIDTRDQADLKGQVSDLIPQNYHFVKKTVPDIPKETITRFFAFKNILVGKTAQVKTFIEADGLLYREKSKTEIETIDRDAFIEEAYGVIKGV